MRRDDILSCIRYELVDPGTTSDERIVMSATFSTVDMISVTNTAKERMSIDHRILLKHELFGLIKGRLYGAARDSVCKLVMMASKLAPAQDYHSIKMLQDQIFKEMGE